MSLLPSMHQVSQMHERELAIYVQRLCRYVGLESRERQLLGARAEPTVTEARPFVDTKSRTLQRGDGVNAPKTP